MIPLIIVVVWLFVLVLVAGLCAAARRGDQGDAQVSPAGEAANAGGASVPAPRARVVVHIQSAPAVPSRTRRRESGGHLARLGGARG
jgi:hypothetical protein